MTIKPYYSHAGITIYHGDAQNILPDLEAECILTDPIWPNSVFDGVNPQDLLEATLEHAPGQRCVIHLGCDSDPRFLAAVPKRWPFLRVCWLDYARPSYKGRLLYGSDVAYVFGVPPPPRNGHFLMPGKCMAQRTGENIQREILAGKSFCWRIADRPVCRQRHNAPGCEVARRESCWHRNRREVLRDSSKKAQSGSFRVWR